MTERRKQFWHDIARQVEKEVRPPRIEEEFEELMRHGWGVSSCRSF
jgi:hypothetical protein